MHKQLANWPNIAHHPFDCIHTYWSYSKSSRFVTYTWPLIQRSKVMTPSWSRRFAFRLKTKADASPLTLFILPLHRLMIKPIVVYRWHISLFSLIYVYFKTVDPIQMHCILILCVKWLQNKGILMIKLTVGAFHRSDFTLQKLNWPRFVVTTESPISRPDFIFVKTIFYKQRTYI